MREQGLAGKALSLSVTSSMIGGIFSALVLLFFAPLIGKMGYLFGAPEYFAIAMMGMTCLAGVSGKDLCKGIASGLLGLCMAMIGQDAITGMTRFTFGSVQMISGISLIPGLIGLFAVTEVLSKAEEIGREKKGTITDFKFYPPKLADYIHIKWILFKSCLIGTVIGAIPGTGPTISAWMAYNEAKRSSKHPELYGKGSSEGVIACEASNNAVTGGAMIPLTTLGIPGDSVTAILLGAFIMKGITPGPMMYVTELPTVYRVFAALMLANLCMLVVGCLGVRFFAKIVSVEKKMLYPIILVISLLGAFSINKNAFDVGVCVAFGIIGWLMNKYEFPLSPILLALILGPMCEKNFVRYMNIQRGNFFAITTSPIAMVFATVAILVIVYSVYNQSKINKRAAANAAKENA